MMPGQRSSAPDLVGPVRRIHALLSAGDILVQACREARALTGAAVAFGSYAPHGQQWSAGTHVAVESEPCSVSPPALSAAYALFRRLAVERKAFAWERGAENQAIFAGLSAPPRRIATALYAVPLFRRSGRLIGELILVDDDRARFAPFEEEALGVLATCASAALENALKFAFAKRDQDRLLLFAEATEEALWDWNLQTDEIWWGGGIQNLLGRGGSTVQSRPDWKSARIHPGDMDRVQRSLKQALSSGQSSWREEYRFRRTDGSWAFVEERSYFLRAADGSAYRIIGALRDITEKKQIEDEQRFLVDATAALAESLDVAVTLDRAARVAIRSIADWCTITLVDSRTGKPRRVAVAHGDENRVQQLRAMTDEFSVGAKASIGAEYVLHTGETQLIRRFEETHHRALAEMYPGFEALTRSLDPHSLLSVPMRAPGGRLLGAITLLTTGASGRGYGPADVGFVEEFARRCAIAVENAHLFQQAQEAIRVRDEFLSIASHELKTPLTPLQLQIHTLEKKLSEFVRDGKQEWVAKRLVTIQRQSARLNRLISGLLDISRIVGGRLSLEFEELDMVALVRAVVEDFRQQGEISRAQSEVHVHGDGAIVGRWDRMRLEQVVTNLLSNALKYGAGKPVSVSTSVTEGVAVLTVEDQGIGIDLQDQERIFGRFERAVSARHYGGLGLGLFIVRQIVEAMGGSIQVVSELGQGAKFTVSLPLEGERESAAEAPARAQSPSVDRGHPHAAAGSPGTIQRVPE